MLFMPTERAVAYRAIEQKLLQFEIDLWRMKQAIDAFPLGNLPIQNNYPLPPVPDNDCTLTCVDGTPTIPVGSDFAFRRLEIDGVNLDWSDSDSAWLSATLPDPFVCAGVDQDVRWKFSATALTPGSCLLEFQYLNQGSMEWETLAEATNAAAWDSSCGLYFEDVTNDIVGCETAYPFPVCLNPVNLCDGENATTFLNTSRVFTFTVSGLSGSIGLRPCSNFNRSWSMAYNSLLGTGIWYEGFVASGFSYTATLTQKPGDSSRMSLEFRSVNFPAALYQIKKCDLLIPGTSTWSRYALNGCTGWPSTLDITVT